MKRERRTFTNAFKTEVILEALKKRLSTAQLAEKYKLYPSQLSNWKAEFLEKFALVFGADEAETSQEKARKEKLEEGLFVQIVQLPLK